MKEREGNEGELSVEEVKKVEVANQGECVRV